ncbi:COP9 signalosome complex subunit 6 [Balamuthia mandrillaris]
MMDIEKAAPKSGTVIEKETGSALDILLHPLVIINISDHYTRAKVTTEQADPRVIGALMGVQSGRNVEIFNSFELVYNEVEGAVVIDLDYLKRKQEQFETVFKGQDLLGWYSTGKECKPSDIEIHNQFMGINESPLYLLLDPVASTVSRELPITIFESELRIINDEPTMLFSTVPYKIETVEAERISVDHVAHVTSGHSEGSQLASHLMGMHNAIKMLHMRIQLLRNFLVATAQGKIPKEHGLLRETVALCNLLPAIDTEQFKEEFVKDYNDALLVTYLASITKGSNIINELVDRYNTAYERQSRRRGFAGFF